MCLVQMFVNAEGPIEMPKWARNVQEIPVTAKEIEEDGYEPNFRQYWLDVANFDIAEAERYLNKCPNVIDYWY